MFLDRPGNEIQWPAPWEGIGYPWYFDCRERAPADVTTAAAQAALADLVQTLHQQSGAYWLTGVAEHQLHEKYGVSIAGARRLMRDCPGSASPERGIWCAATAAPLWGVLKSKVRAVLRADALLTLDEIAAAVDVEVDAGMVFAALSALCWDHVAVALQDAGDVLYFCKARPGGRWADYNDLYRLRVGSAPQPAS